MQHKDSPPHGVIQFFAASIVRADVESTGNVLQPLIRPPHFSLEMRPGVCALGCCLLIPSLHSWASGPVIVLIGLPGSSRAVQAAMLKSQNGMTVISADGLIARNPQVSEKSRNSPIQGFDPRLDPAVNELLEVALSTADLSKGLVLVGYPASKAQGDYLVSLRERLSLPKALVIRLVVPDDVARKQLKKNKVLDIDQQLQNYHRELDFARAYFPQADIRDINGNRNPAKVANDIRKLLPK